METKFGSRPSGPWAERRCKKKMMRGCEGRVGVRRHCGRVVVLVALKGDVRVEYCLKRRRKGCGFDIVAVRGCAWVGSGDGGELMAFEMEMD